MENAIFGIFGMGPQELIIVLVIIVFLFGAKKLPELARGLGQGVREFKNAANNVKEEIEREASRTEVANDATPKVNGASVSTPEQKQKA
jgi:sec-independent protein translocase protein TatA